MPKTAEKTYAIFSHSSNQKIIAALEAKNARVFLFPPLETEKINLNEREIDDLRNLESFDWIIFPDNLSVEFFLQILEENDIDFFKLDELRVCAFGEAVSDSLRFVQLHADVVPTSISPTIVFNALSEYIGRGDFNFLKFLLPKASSSRYEIAEILRGQNAAVLELAVYQTNKINSSEISKLKVLLDGGAIDEFIFSAPPDLIALNRYFGEHECRRILSEIKLSAVGQSIIRLLRENNFEANYFK